MEGSGAILLRVVRKLARGLLGPNLQANLRTQQYNLRAMGGGGFIRWNSILLDAWVRDRLNRRAHTVLSKTELRDTRKSGTVFIFGSGYSLNDISLPEWRHFEEYDTFGFTGFIYQKWVRVDYHLIRGWTEVKEGALNWRGSTGVYARVLNANSCFRNTILIMQGEYLAQFCNQLIGYRFIQPGTRMFRYTTARAWGPPTRSLGDGVRHMVGTLSDAVNFAYCLGWKEIVLVGVDLYDARYFWLDPDETLGLDKSTGMLKPAKHTTRGIRYDQRHNTARRGVVELMGQWREMFEKENVHMSVYNPRSLLTEVMSVYQPDHQSG